MFACIPLLAPSDNSASTFRALHMDVSQDVPIGQVDPSLEMLSLAQGPLVDEDLNNDGQDDSIPDTVAIVFSILLLMALSGYRLLLDDRWLSRLGRIYYPTLERPG